MYKIMLNFIGPITTKIKSKQSLYGIYQNHINIYSFDEVFIKIINIM